MKITTCPDCLGSGIDPQACGSEINCGSCHGTGVAETEKPARVEQGGKLPDTSIPESVDSETHYSDPWCIKHQQNHPFRLELGCRAEPPDTDSFNRNWRPAELVGTTITAWGDAHATPEPKHGMGCVGVEYPELCDCAATPEPSESELDELETRILDYAFDREDEVGRAPQPSRLYAKQLAARLRPFIDSQKQSPMGASAWQAHGEKYGYTKFFEDQKREYAVEKIETMRLQLQRDAILVNNHDVVAMMELIDSLIDQIQEK